MSDCILNYCEVVALVDACLCGFRRNRDTQLRATINQKLIETGERDRCVGVFHFWLIQFKLYFKALLMVSCNSTNQFIDRL